MSSFTHLHVHTEFSLLDGMSRIKDLTQHAKELGMDALAITDHGVMYGVMDFYRACKADGLKPIIGVETYLAPRRMTDRDPQQDKRAYHLLLIAENEAGYKNLLKIASASQIEGYYYRPRIDKDFLAAHSDGLICTSGCLAAEIPTLLDRGRDEEAKRMLGWYVDVFGPDRFYVELQNHDIPELHAVNKKLLQIAPFAEVPYLATNDVHYVRRDDAAPHDVLLCIGTGSKFNDRDRMRFSGDSYYLRSPQEMWQIFGEWPDSLANSIKIAEMCNLELDDDSYKLPHFTVPEGYTTQTYLRELCEGGLYERYGSVADSDGVRQRLSYELDIIHNMGFDAYFLIVWDLCRYARENDIWYNVRGSGAGSLVAYTLRITNIDPLQNGLLFERFLNPGRVSMPDIDIDYPDDRRAEMIQYCVQKYGEDRVAQIITFGTLGARAAVRDVARTLDIPLHEVDALAKLIPAIPGKNVTIAQALAEITDFRKAYEDKARPYLRELIDTAQKLEGISRHSSVHAAGVIISDAPLVEYTPLGRQTGKDDLGLSAVSQWPMAVIESIGLLKVDFLGLRTLTIMRKACELIELYHGVSYNLDTIPYRHMSPGEPGADEYNEMLDRAFMLMSQGDTGGVFQVEGDGMTRVLTEMKPTQFEHIVAAISLFRPGPLEYIPAYIRRMHRDEAVTYHHPLLEGILSETFGIIVYQEQIMQIASELFGYELGEADLMRRAVAKKKEKDLLKHRAIFKERGPNRGIPAEVAEAIFADIEFFARYGFNKSHAADYAVLTVQTAFLKAHYRHEYLTALMTIEHGNTDKVSRYLSECRRSEIEVLPPSILSSGYEFTIEEMQNGSRAIRYGLSGIKNVGDGSISEILRARADKPIADIIDLCHRTDLRIVGKKALESLIKVGALDELGDRLQLLESIDRMMSFSSSQHKAADVGQMSMFGEAATGTGLSGTLSDVLVREVKTAVTRREMLIWERELIGVRLSGHSLDPIREHIKKVVTIYSTDIVPHDHDRSVVMVGVVIDVRPHTTKNNKPMAFARIEDLYGEIDIVIWPRTWQETRDLWIPDRTLLLRGKLDAAQGEPKLLCESVSSNFTALEPISDSNDNSVQADIPEIPLWAMHDTFEDDEIPPPNYLTDGGTIPQPPGPEANAQGSVPEAPMPVAEEAVQTMDRESTQESNSRNLKIIARSQPQPIDSSQSVHLRIYISKTGNGQRDRLRLQQIHGQLISVPGEDTFSFVMTDNGRRVEVSFKEKTNSRANMARLEQNACIEMIELIQT